MPPSPDLTELNVSVSRAARAELEEFIVFSELRAGGPSKAESRLLETLASALGATMSRN